MTGVQCFGDNTDGQAGGNYERPGPVEVQGNVTELALGVTTSCALTDLGVECWGANDFNQFGDGGPGGETPRLSIRPPLVDHLSAGGSRLFCSSGRDNAKHGRCPVGDSLVRRTAASTLAASLARGAQRRPQSFLRSI